MIIMTKYKLDRLGRNQMILWLTFYYNNRELDTLTFRTLGDERAQSIYYFIILNYFILK